MWPGIICRLTLIVAITALSSCGVTFPRTGYTSLQKVKCEKKPDYIHLYFQGEKVDFEYEKIGMIEVVSGRSESNDKMLDYLKYRAWLHCADAVINVRHDYKSTTSSSGDDITTTEEKIFFGLAVKLVVDTATALPADTSFVNTVKTDEINRDKIRQNRVTGAAVLSILTVVFLMMSSIL